MTNDPAFQAGERAASLFASDSLLCAESVLTAVAEYLEIDSPLIPRAATGFCSGLSRTCGPCGALTGAVMGIGLGLGRDSGDDPLNPTYDCVQEFKNIFLEKHGSMDCRTLTGCDLGTDEGRTEFKERELNPKLCRELVRDAARTAVELLLKSPAAL